jgi:hypothetical protein
MASDSANPQNRLNPVEKQLISEVAHYRRLARANYFTLYFLYVVAIAASILSTLLALAKTSGPYLAVVTATPAVILLANSTFKFRERAEWHYEKRRRLASLLRKRQAGAPGTAPPEMAESWNKIDEDMDKKWPGWGALPTTSGKSDSEKGS